MARYSCRSIVPLWIACLAFPFVARAADAPDPPFDVLLANGRLIDGTGSPWRRADVGVRGDRIAAVGMLRGHASARTIDCAGLVVSPGFIDMLGNSESELLDDPRALSKLYQGISSEITGEGGSIAPRVPRPGGRAVVRGKPPREFATLSDYFKALEAARPAINLGTYVGAGGLRSMVIGSKNRPATAPELSRMESLIDGAMRDGAMGVSSALEYTPGGFASTDELIALCGVAARYGGLYATHMRNEGDRVIPSVDEAVRIGREAGLPVEIFHLKVMGRGNWGNMKQVVERIDRARASGVDVTADMYPYTAARTGLGACLPPRILELSGDALAQKLRDPSTRAELKRELSGQSRDWENLYQEAGPDGILIESLPDDSMRRYERRTLAAIARERHEDPIDALLDLLAATRGGGGAFYFGMSEEDVRTAMRRPWVSFGQDAHARSRLNVFVHPRAFGTFARVLAEYVRRDRVLTLEDAVRKMTSQAAGRVRLGDRGIVRPGFFADLAVFDPGAVQDRAEFGLPPRFAAGMKYLFVNGVMELAGGAPTGERGGRPLYGPGLRSPAKSE